MGFHPYVFLYFCWFWTFHKRFCLAATAGIAAVVLVIPNATIDAVFGTNRSWGLPVTGVVLSYLIAYCTMPPYPSKVSQRTPDERS
jgi:phage shock protein PspC (stress-responsive transcriptional regulator)